MISKIIIAVALSTCLVASATMAKDIKIPEIDLQKRCKASETAVNDMFGDQSADRNAFGTCMSPELKARDALIAAWKDVPDSYKLFCINPKAHSPSYMEWIACLEMRIDAKTIRQQNSGAATAGPQRCPVVQFDDENSIKIIRACGL